VDAYIVIGNPNTRRASLIRSLTGCFNRSVRDIALRDGKAVIRLYARAGSLQETRATAADFIAEAGKSRCAAVLCCLSPDQSSSHADLYPPAQDYLAAFESAGWKLRAIAVLGQNAGGVRGPLLRQFPLAPTAPINLTSRAVLDHFGWV
jgi:hypothetical protein